MSERDEPYTPSTEQVRSHYVFDQSNRWDADRGIAFDRWLASVRRDAQADALEEVANLIEPMSGIGLANGAPRSDVAEWVRRRAAAIRRTGETNS